MAFCIKCGNQLGTDARFCPRCGTPVGAQTPTPSLATPQITGAQPSAGPNRRGIIGVAAALIIVLVGLGAYLLLRGGSEKSELAVCLTGRWQLMTMEQSADGETWHLVQQFTNAYTVYAADDTVTHNDNEPRHYSLEGDTETIEGSSVAHRVTCGGETLVRTSLSAPLTRFTYARAT